MEKELRYELAQAITQLKDSIYPTNAPETATKPYLVYERVETDPLKALGGYTGKQRLRFVLSIMAVRYSDMKTLTEAVLTELMTFTGSSIGISPGVYIEDLTINNISETYEFELMVNRGIIDFSVFY